MIRMDTVPEISCSNALLGFSSQTLASPTFVAAWDDIHVSEKESVTIAIDRVQEQFAGRRFTVSGQRFAATMRFGIAGFQGRVDPNLSDLMGQVDAALCVAKNKDRNRIEFAHRHSNQPAFRFKHPGPKLVPKLARGFSFFSDAESSGWLRPRREPSWQRYCFQFIARSRNGSTVELTPQPSA